MTDQPNSGAGGPPGLLLEGRSIYPRFAVNAPLPAGIAPPPAPAGASSDAAGTGPTPSPPKRP